MVKSLTPEYFLLRIDDQANVTADDDWLRSEAVLGCPSCFRVLYGREVDAVVEYGQLLSKISLKIREPPRKHKIGGCIGIIRNDLRDAIGLDNLEKAFFIGRAKVKPLVPGEQYSTLVIRGDKQINYLRTRNPLLFDHCPECGYTFYAPDELEDIYFLKPNPIDEVYAGMTPDLLILRKDVMMRVLFELPIPEMSFKPLILSDKAPDNCPRFLFPEPGSASKAM
jgi:hypothetical protein